MNTIAPPAPPWQVERWFNTDRPLDLVALRGKVVVLEAFQMLCPGCVSHGLPQAQRVHATFQSEHVAVVGLHTVFEHHQAMTPTALEAFLYEYRIDFPVGIDRADPQMSIPATMHAYAMRGTPTLVLIDTRGRLRHRHFGQVADLVLGAQIASLLQEATDTRMDRQGEPETTAAGACGEEACRI